MVISIIFISSCSDKFPANELIHKDQKNKICDVYLIDEDTIKIKYDHSIKYEECPQIFGFRHTDIGKISSWIRRNKNNLQECN